MSIAVRLTQPLHEELRRLAARPVEHGAVLLAELVTPTEGDPFLLAHELIPVADDAYLERSDCGMTIASDGYVHALKRANDRGLTALWVHNHPGDDAIPRSSRHDQQVDEQLHNLFADRTNSGHYGALIVSSRGTTIAFTGHITGTHTGPISRINVIGDRWSFLDAEDSSSIAVPHLFDRNIRAFGGQIQAVISTLTIAIVGAGGTGSAVAEQLVRLGVRSFLLFDPDTLSETNTTRVYGSTPESVGRAKVDVLADHLRAIAPDVHIRRFPAAVTELAIATALQQADVVFGCTDDNAGRLRLSRLPYYLLAPLIDCGVVIPATAAGIIDGVFGRVTVAYPGSACLLCRDRIDMQRAVAEERSAEEQARLEKEGYAPALGGTEPAVVAFTTLVAATAVAEFLEHLIGYGETPSPTELVLYVHDRRVGVNATPPQPGHYCDPNQIPVRSDNGEFLGANWAS